MKTLVTVCMALLRQTTTTKEIEPKERAICSGESTLTNNKCITSDTEEEDKCVERDEGCHDRTSIFQGNLLRRRSDGDYRTFDKLSKERGRIHWWKATVIESDGHLLHSVRNLIWKGRPAFRGESRKPDCCCRVSVGHLTLSVFPAEKNVIVILLRFSNVASQEIGDATYLFLSVRLGKKGGKEGSILSSTRLCQIKSQQHQ